MSRSVAKLI